MLVRFQLALPFFVPFEQKITPAGLFLATVLEIQVFAFVAVFMIVVAILFCNRFHSCFSCHGQIIT